MLVLTRKQGQRVLVGDVWVTVVQTAGGRVKLGFTDVDASKKTPVKREDMKSDSLGFALDNKKFARPQQGQFLRKDQASQGCEANREIGGNESNT